ncbi:unnamed protein product [Phaeothamnion confervicola]
MGLPKTIVALKKHPKYVNEKALGKYEGVVPGAQVCGLVKGQRVFLRADVWQLRSVTQWKKERRQVKADQADRPAKRVPMTGRGKGKGAGAAAAGDGNGGSRRVAKAKKPKNAKGTAKRTHKKDELSDSESSESDGGGGGKSDSDDDASGDSSEKEEEDPDADRLVPFYGHWQTEPWAPSPVVDGKIPKNDYGNVELWEGELAYLPAGAALLLEPGMGPVAKKLGVDYAPAVTGFDVRQGRSVPRLGGTVVPADSVEMLLDAWRTSEREKADRARARLEATNAKRWEKLVKALQTRQRLYDQYGA